MDESEFDDANLTNTKRSFSLREVALLQSFSNGIIQFYKDVTLKTKSEDHTELFIIFAFILAAASDTTRDLTQISRESISRLSVGVLSIASIADMTGIPRQTIRRKCLSLEQKGIIFRDQSRLYRCDIPPHAIEAILQQVGALVKINARLSPFDEWK